MDRSTILTQAKCELTRLPLGAVEAFLLSQVDGRLTLEEIGTIAGLNFAKTVRLAARLVELGAVSASNGERRKDARHSKAPRAVVEAPADSSGRSERRQTRPDPRAEAQSIRPASARPARPEARPDPRAEAQSMRPSKGGQGALDRRSEAQAARRTSRKSMRAVRPDVARGSAQVDDGTCELDEETHTRIVVLDAKLPTLDHYALLEVDRGAERREIKRAYFAMASKFHPDRCFGKKLGPARPALDRIFMRLTEAHDVLSKAATRADYDAELKSVPPPRRSTMRPSKAPPPHEARKSSKAMAAATPAPTPRKTKTSLRPARGSKELPAQAVAVPPQSPLPAPPDARPMTPPPSADDRVRRLYAAAQQIEAQRRVEIFLLAAEDALQNDDVISAANNFRLALQNRDDPFIRQKLDAVDQEAKSRRFEQNLKRAQVAERNEQWGAAAMHYVKAHDALPRALVAERAAHALCMSRGDLHRAATLAEQAVSMDPTNAGYRVTLGEVYLAANLFVRATAEANKALELAPKDAGARALASAITEKKKG